MDPNHTMFFCVITSVVRLVKKQLFVYRIFKAVYAVIDQNIAVDERFVMRNDYIFPA